MYLEFAVTKLLLLSGSLQSLDWNGGLERWTGTVDWNGRRFTDS